MAGQVSRACRCQAMTALRRAAVRRQDGTEGADSSPRPGLVNDSQCTGCAVWSSTYSATETPTF